MAKENLISDCYQIWKKENQNSLNPLTFHRYNNLLEKHLLPYFRDTLAEDITEKDIDIFVDEKQQENMSKVTLNMLIMLLKKMLQTAGIDTIRLGLEHTVRVKANKRTVEIMKENEQYLLDKILNSSKEPKYIGICIAFKMGLAIGEICALEWTDVDFQNEVIQLKNTVQRLQNRKEDGKKTLLVKMSLTNSAQRELPVPQTVMQILKEYRKPGGYVLQCKEGKLPDPRREQIRLEKLFEKNEMKCYNFHTLRDTFAVRCLEAGMSVEHLSYVLGHASVAITAERYKEFLKMKQERIGLLRKIMEMV
jgi:Site-specific recombinase XerC